MRPALHAFLILTAVSICIAPAATRAAQGHAAVIGSCPDAARAERLDAEAEKRTREHADGYAQFMAAAKIYDSCSARSSDSHAQAFYSVAYVSEMLGAANATGTTLTDSIALLHRANVRADALVAQSNMSDSVRSVLLAYRHVIVSELQQEASIQVSRKIR